MPRVGKKQWEKVNPEDLAPLLPEEEISEELMPLRALEGPGLKAEFRGYKKLELLVDFGAAASVMPEKMPEKQLAVVCSL